MNVGLALALLFTLMWGGVFLFRVEPVRRSLSVYQPRERFWVLVTPLLLTVHFTILGMMLSGLPAPEFLRGLGGTVVFGCGMTLWFWARVAIGPPRQRRLPDDPPLRFRQDGPFGIVRNPCALGVLIAAAGPLLIVPSAVSALTFFLSAIALGVRARQEERRMVAQVGAAYEAYCRQVKRLIPFVW